MEFQFYPSAGLGPVRFGMNRTQVREALKETPREFKKTPFSKNTSDAFDETGLHVYYDYEDRCKAIEAFEPAKVKFRNVSLLGVPINVLVPFFQQHDPFLKEDKKEEILSVQLGILLLTQHVYDESEQVDYVLLFRDGYFD